MIEHPPTPTQPATDGQRIDRITLDGIIRDYSGLCNSMDKAYVTMLAHDLRDARSELQALRITAQEREAGLEAEVVRLGEAYLDALMGLRFLAGDTDDLMTHEILDETFQLIGEEKNAETGYSVVLSTISKTLAPQAPASPSGSPGNLTQAQSANRPIKLDVEVYDAGSACDRIVIKSHPIGGFIQMGPKEIIAEVAYRLNAFEVCAAHSGSGIPEKCPKHYKPLFLLDENNPKGFRYCRECSEEHWKKIRVNSPGVPEPTMDNRDGKAEA